MTESNNCQCSAEKKEDPVARSMSKPDCCAKFATIGKPSGSKVMVRVTHGDKSLKRKKKKRPGDKRDVTFW